MKGFFYLARLFGIVPFLRIEKNKLVATKWTLRISFIINSFMAVLYLVYILNNEKIQYLMFRSSDLNDVPYMFACIISAFSYSVDMVNVGLIVLLSQKTHKLFNSLLQNFETMDEKMFPRRPKSKSSFFVILAASVYIAKTYFLVSRYDNFRISFNVGARYIYGMILVTELLISLTCLEIKSRYAKLHSRLKTSTGNCNLEEVRALHTIYSSLRDGHSLFSWHVRKFLLTDISQMVMLIMNGILSVFVNCLVTKEEGEQKSFSWCTTHGIFATDCTWRMCFLMYSCGALQREACCIVFLPSNVLVSLPIFIMELSP
jgi:hypothetical protein